jgi:glycosidase
MNISAIYHRPESEWAYLYPESTCNFRLRTAVGDATNVELWFGEPFEYHETVDGDWEWKNTLQKMEKVATTKLYDYWQTSVVMPTKRIQYAFIVNRGEVLTEDVNTAKRSTESNGLNLPDAPLAIADKTDQCVFYGNNGPLKLSANILKSHEQFFKMAYYHASDMANPPEWSKHMRWYQVFLDRFCDDRQTDESWVSNVGGDKPRKVYGGNLKGLISKLDYLKDLGFNGVYLCPIFTSPSIHKYNTEDYYQIDPQYGTKGDFKLLVNELHKRDMKIMLDGVFNHIGSTHPFWQDVVKNQEKSKYVDWFCIKKFPILSVDDPQIMQALQRHRQFSSESDDPQGEAPGASQGETQNNPQDGSELTLKGGSSEYYFKGLEYEAFSFGPIFPKINLENPETREYFIEVGKYWIKNFDIDSWRMDVADEISHSFWKRFARECRSVKEDIYLVGECQLNAQAFLEGDEFDAVMNYKMTRLITRCLLNDELSYSDMESMIAEHLMLYRHQVNDAQMNMLDSHDTERILTQAKGDVEKVKEALTLNYSLPGSPCVYYGTEVGMTGASDPDCRRTMIWDPSMQDHEMLEFIRELNRKG